MDIGETLFDIIFNPKMALQNISIYKPAAAAGLIVFLTTYLASLIVMLPSEFFQGNLIATLTFGFSAALLRLIGVIIISTFLFLVAKLLRGQGSFLGLFSGLGFAHFLLAFLAFPELIREMWGWQFVASWLRGVVLIWFVILAVIAIRESQSFSTGKALITVSLTITGLIFLSLFISFSFLGLFI